MGGGGDLAAAGPRGPALAEWEAAGLAAARWPARAQVMLRRAGLPAAACCQQPSLRASRAAAAWCRAPACWPHPAPCMSGVGGCQPRARHPDAQRPRAYRRGPYACFAPVHACHPWCAVPRAGGGLAAPLTLHPSPLTHHPSSSITRHPSLLTPHPSPLISHPSITTLHSSPLTRHPPPFTHLPE